MFPNIKPEIITLVIVSDVRVGCGLHSKDAGIAVQSFLLAMVHSCARLLLGLSAAGLCASPVLSALFGFPDCLPSLLKHDLWGESGASLLWSQLLRCL